ncbi:hypothetical protein TIFTF001_026727 [Ficus carica]|uniref:Uncharacterized protein n=1 Tax=Ficus carica TaxID=3494 RepID=A0AA88DLP8_FICCA|nr:hypothetical protein TIFTF001_026727 [Ficus carica]
MRPASYSNATVGDGGFRHWNSPIPFLFGGLALMLGLITVALVILACSHRKPSPAPNSGAATNVSNTEEKPAVQVNVVVDSDQPKIVVIMAGDDMPTYLAKPVVCSTLRDQGDHDQQAAL